MINNTNELNLDYVKKTGAILILRKPEKINLQDLIKFKSRCKTRKIKLYIANNLRFLFLLGTNNFYISAYNKKKYLHLNRINKNINIIGSAHNISEIKEKIEQGCDKIFLSRLFQTKYLYKKGHLGKVKFNLLTRKVSASFVALGGIKKENFNQIKNLNINGIAIQSDKKKAGKYIPAFF